MTICVRCERELEVGAFEVKDGKVVRELDSPWGFVCGDCQTAEERESGIIKAPPDATEPPSTP